MPEMVTVEKVFCRSRAWGQVAGRIVVPWALQRSDLSGCALEVGGGGGAMAAAICARYHHLVMTVTDFDPGMVDVARQRLATFGSRVNVRQADATALPFDDGSFDAALTFLMLHHVGDWPAALRELVRVLRPGGVLLGYDLLDTAPVRVLHRLEGETAHPARSEALAIALARLPLEEVDVRRTAGALVARFRGIRR